MAALSGTTRVYALLGHPVAHSGSPALHNGWFATHGIDAVYVALDVDPARGGSVVDALRTLPLAGCNLTIPFKADVVPALDRLAGLAAAAGVVNTIVREDDGSLTGHNTDGDGFLDAVASTGRPATARGPAVVLGAGGAGRAVAAALVRDGVDVTVVNRTVARAEEAARAIAGLGAGRVSVAPWTPQAIGGALARAGLVVQATSGAGASAVAALPIERVSPDALWCDLNYWMDAPPAWDGLAARGVATQDGSMMLRRQAARAFHLWTGVDPDPVRAGDRVG